MVASLMLRAPADILSKARDEISRQGFTPSDLASELSIAVQLVDNFLNGEIVDRHTYNLVCEKLGISLTTLQEGGELSGENLSEPSDDDANRETPTIFTNASRSNRNVANANELLSDGASKERISQNVNQNSSDQNSSDNIALNLLENIDLSVHSLRQRISAALIRQCDRLRIIDVSVPVCLHDLYTELSVFTNLPSSQYLDLNETFANIPPEQYDRFYLDKLHPPIIPASRALEEFKLVLLVGGLGSGKTTLLKYLAMACVAGKILPKYLPVFLPLRSLVSPNDSDPFTWLKKQITIYGLLDESSDHQLLEQLLIKGRLLLFWDGIDDLPEANRGEIVQQITNFSDRYPKNRMVFSSRNPIYGHILESFSAFAIAPFQDSQISTFASKWFQVTCAEKPKKNEKFQQLLATNKPLAEIARNPLLLTYLCNVFNSCEYLKPNFYQEILDLLLTKWNQTKCFPLHGDRELSTSQKQDLLSYIAIVSLDRHGYVWQNNELEDDFQACISNSRSLAVPIDRDRLLQSFKWQHSLLIECAKGFHSLNYTTLHDYLAAYRLANSAPSAAQNYLLERIYLRRWHGVIVMTISISQQADHILQMMKRKIDEIVSKDPHLQSFLTWVNQQSIQIRTPYKAVTIRALYLDVDLENARSLDRARALDIAHSRSLERALAKAMGADNSITETQVDIDYTINLALNLDLALYFANHPILELACVLEPDLSRALQFLRQKFPDPYKNRDVFAKWWQAKGLDWSKKLRNLIVQHRKSSQEWQFSDTQLKVLRTYHDANKLLIECLNNAEYVSPLIKNQIESTLLLPQGEYNLLHY
ncbi:NACHT domain-containing protein [Pseudanabaena sp. UWO310]|uniref:NACHT domain-containing protein n=1 Tax=Pseudanabaena sp. UWO310 TaxID=2480795 RepID=UPI00115B80AD|nr:NACHT domain-containing protein [Pseudanabaena sp. UWO310]TYQ28806.1 NACHT domain-containing protein [Pseudanabaena sp. UWO310]